MAPEAVEAQTRILEMPPEAVEAQTGFLEMAPEAVEVQTETVDMQSTITVEVQTEEYPLWSEGIF